MTASKALTFALLAHLCIAGTACSVFGSDDSAPAAPGSDAPDGGGGPKAQMVGGPPDQSELTEALGIFVSATGTAKADGSRAHPLLTIQSAIDVAKIVGKRVYVCKGTYKEAIVVADSISIIGGLDCSTAIWRTTLEVSHIVSPTSPALRADDIVTATRLEGLDILAPAATAPSGSSIGLIAQNANAITIARTTITAGDGASGSDGVEGTQLTNDAATVNGGALIAWDTCTGTKCKEVVGIFVAPDGGRNGYNGCGGATAHGAGAGGVGGKPGLWEAVAPNGVNFVWQPYRNSSYLSTNGDKTEGASAGAQGDDGANAPPTGALSHDGYAPANGIAGKDGQPGAGGYGGNGSPPSVAPYSVSSLPVYIGVGGAGGGAGGCPGLAGSAGAGGGASIAALLLASTITFESSQLSSGRAGNAGHGTFGSVASLGGKAGVTPFGFTPPAAAYGEDGGRGGVAGFSGNGTSGPSLGIAHDGAAPKMDSTTKITVGSPGAAIDPVSHKDALGFTKTIPATPAGIAQDVLSF